MIGLGCDDRAMTPKEKNDYQVKRLLRIVRDVKWESRSLIDYSVGRTIQRMFYLAYSPLAGGLMGTLYGVGLLMGCAAPFDMVLGDYLTEYGCDFDRHVETVHEISYACMGEKREIISSNRRREHAIVTKCSMVSLFTGCLGNTIISRKNPTTAILAKQRVPFFLLGALGVVLGQYASTYTSERNEALIREAEYVMTRLNE